MVAIVKRHMPCKIVKPSKEA
eukprot:SAG11_NODE_34799_length_270_cov_0.602339_1_plen_20_part_10